MRKLSEEGNKRLNVKTPLGLLRRIDAWRRLAPDMPNQSEAIRRLIEAGLDAAEKGSKGKKKAP
jgi:metal-responsive CopG/Arc/MetJ family transcriptional regulator